MKNRVITKQHPWEVPRKYWNGSGKEESGDDDDDDDSCDGSKWLMDSLYRHQFCSSLKCDFLVRGWFSTDDYVHKTHTVEGLSALGFSSGKAHEMTGSRMLYALREKGCFLSWMKPSLLAQCESSTYSDRGSDDTAKKEKRDSEEFFFFFWWMKMGPVKFRTSLENSILCRTGLKIRVCSIFHYIMGLLNGWFWLANEHFKVCSYFQINTQLK